MTSSTTRVPCGPNQNFGLPTSSNNINIASRVTSEHDYLTRFRQFLNNAKDENNHIHQLHDTYRKRALEYIKITIVLCVVLAFLWIVRVFDANEWLPTGALEFMTILIISIGCIGEYILIFGIPNVYTGLISRSLTNYDEIVYKNPDTSKKTSTTITATVRPNPTGGSNPCQPTVYNGM